MFLYIYFYSSSVGCDFHRRALLKGVKYWLWFVHHEYSGSSLVFHFFILCAFFYSSVAGCVSFYRKEPLQVFLIFM